MLRLQGAQLVEVPAVPYANPNNYVKLSGRLAERLASEEPNGAVWANQFDNVANRVAHLTTTGPEIYEALEGAVDAFICACGTGGTLAGVAMALKDRNPDVKIGLADPYGAAIYSYYTTGELKAEGASITEDRSAGSPPISSAPVTSPTASPMTGAHVFDPRAGGPVAGRSRGSTARHQTGARYGPGNTVVTVLCDGGQDTLQALQRRLPAQPKPADAALARRRRRWIKFVSLIGSAAQATPGSASRCGQEFRDARKALSQLCSPTSFRNRGSQRTDERGEGDQSDRQ
jgi:cysteine synthase